MVNDATPTMHMDVHTDWGNAEIEAPLLGRFNAANLLAVLSTLLVSGIALNDACAALAHILPPPGRMQTLGGGARPLVIVDYAHTPDAMEKVLATLREIAQSGRLTCVFGCGGNRDPGKRPLMGRAAFEGADTVTRVHLRAVAPMSLGHRLRRDPLDDAGSGTRVARTVSEVLP